MLHLLLKGFFSYLEKKSPEQCRKMGEGFGSLLWNLGYRKKVILKNLDIAFPDKSQDWKEEIGKKSLQNIGRVFFEWPKIPKYVKSGEIEKIVELKKGKELLFEGSKGKILISAHIGNWELAGAYLHNLTKKTKFLAYKMKNDKLNNLINSLRKNAGMEIIFHNQSMKDFVKAINEGEILTFLADQNALLHRGVFVDFFGFPASTIFFPAKLAIKYDKDVLFGYVCFDSRKNKYFAEVEKIEFNKTGDLQKDIKNLVQAYTKKIEETVRKYPEQYFWVHKRWKTRPKGEPENVYD